jgi:hypothetical protein
MSKQSNATEAIEAWIVKETEHELEEELTRVNCVDDTELASSQ